MLDLNEKNSYIFSRGFSAARLSDCGIFEPITPVFEEIQRTIQG